MKNCEKIGLLEDFKNKNSILENQVMLFIKIK